jgi:hypothetical protein
MSAYGAPDEVLAEQIKWWDALADCAAMGNHERLLDAARNCLHPDAQWLASLFPVSGGAVTHEHMRTVLQEHGAHHPVGVYVAALLHGDGDSMAHLERAAALGYAPAVGHIARISLRSNGGRRRWAERAEALGDREGTFQLAESCLENARCPEDEQRAIELYRRAAEWGHGLAQEAYAQTAFPEGDWRRILWLGRAAQRGACLHFRTQVLELLPVFAGYEMGRVLHTAAPVMRGGLDVAKRTLFGRDISGREGARVLRVLHFHEAMLWRARTALLCWSVVGRRLRVAKDVRIMIAKMVWEQVWEWGERQQ